MSSREQEEIATAVARVAADIEAAARRAGRAVRDLERMGAEPNVVLATREAAERLSEAADELRRRGLLAPQQQRLL